MWSYLAVKWAFEVFIIITRAFEVERARSAFRYFSLRNKLVWPIRILGILLHPMLIMLTIFYTCWFCFQCWYSIKIIVNSHCTNKQCLLLKIVIISYKEMNYQAESNRVSMTVISSTSVVISDGLILIPDSWFHQFWANKSESRIKCQFWFFGREMTLTYSIVGSTAAVAIYFTHVIRGSRTDIITVNSCRHGSHIHNDLQYDIGLY